MEKEMAGVRRALPWAAAASVVALLVGCDNGPSAVAGKQAAGTQMASAQAPASRPGEADGGSRVDHRKDPVTLLDGKPEWAASRRYSAEESAQHAYARNGEAFAAKGLEDYVRKAHAFVEHPPKGVETITRPNGDTLFYDAKNNVFAVADKAGAPRTMFKPDDGAAYWQEQKDREAKRQTARAERRPHKSGDDDA
jgi:pyocin large subunit-like protein